MTYHRSGSSGSPSSGTDKSSGNSKSVEGGGGNDNGPEVWYIDRTWGAFD